MQHNNHMLQEICKASAMKATTAMSKFLKVPIKLDMKPIKIETIKKIDLPNHFNESTVGIFAPINSSILGGSLLLSTKKSALAACDLMLSREEGCTNEITEVEESALKELANIVLGNFLTPFAHSLLIASLMHSSATYEYSTSTAIANHLRSVLLNRIGEATVLNISFSYEHSNVKGDINIILDAKKTDFLLKEMMVLVNG